MLTVLLGLSVIAGQAHAVERSTSATRDSVIPPARTTITRIAGSAYGVKVVGQHHPRMQVINARTGAVVWSRGLPGHPGFISSQHAGTFETGIWKSGEGWLLAYRVAHGAISSDIQGHSNGESYGDEGVKLVSSGFVVRQRDRSHVGSVRYRFETRFAWSGTSYSPAKTIQVPDYSPETYPEPNAIIDMPSGNVVLLRLQVANTEQERATGLMRIRTLDPDSGMVFVWGQPAFDSFWMENTYIPLTVAFLDSQGTILEMQDMAPLTTTLHTPTSSYWYAVEVNQGFFASHGIPIGDHIQLHLSPAGG